MTTLFDLLLSVLHWNVYFLISVESDSTPLADPCSPLMVKNRPSGKAGVTVQLSGTPFIKTGTNIGTLFTN